MIDTAAGPAADPPGSTAQDIVLRAENVRVEYDGERPTRAVRGVSFELRRGEVLGIAGRAAAASRPWRTP